MNTRRQTIRSVISMLLALAMMSVITNSIAGSVGNSYIRALSAEDQAVEWLNKVGLESGWDDQKKRFISMGWVGFDVASFRISDLGYKFGNLEKLEKHINRQKMVIAKYLADVDAKAAENLRRATLADRLTDAMDAAIQILDKKYWTEEWTEKKKKKYAKARKRYAEALADYDDLKKQAEAHAGAVQQEAGTIETRAALQLYGAIPIAQFESWDKDSDQYQVATVVFWSVKMEKLLGSAIRGESVRVPPGSLSLEQFAGGFEKVKRVNIGGRFRDDKGVVYILGTGFAAIGGGQSLSTARVLAEQIAREEILMAIYSELSSHKKADREGGFQHDIAVHTFEGQEEQRVNQQIQKLSGSKMVDPISQQPVYATVFALSLDDYAKSALE